MKTFFHILYNRHCILALPVFLFLSGIAFSQTPVSNYETAVSGIVLDLETNEVINSASVILSYDDGKKISETKSDLKGVFTFPNIQPGSYKVSARRIGYKNAEKNITLSDKERLELKIELAPEEINIDKINVTATKTEQTLQQTPSSISIVTSDDIKYKNILTFDNILQGVEGVAVTRTSGINVNSLSIRGSSDVAGGGIGNRVLLLLDGRPSLTGDSKGALWSLIPVSIIERTEVVKGAFSSLYGSSAIGGVVNVITKKPTYTPYTGININYGFYNKLNDSLKFSNSLQTFRGIDAINSNTLGKFSYLLNFNYKKNDGHAEQTDYEFYGGMGKFMYDLFSNRDLEFTVQYTKSNSAYPHYWRKEAGAFAEPYKTTPYYLGDRIKKETSSFDIYYRAIPNAASKYTSRFYYYSLASESFYNPKNPVSAQFGSTVTGLNTYINSYNFGNISQVDFQIGKKNYFITGFDAQWNIVRSNPEEILYGNQQQNNFGVYAQNQYKIITGNTGEEILTSTIGGRVDRNVFVGGTATTQFSPKFSLVFTPQINSNWCNEVSYRFLVGRAFRSPSIAELFFKKELFGGFDFVYNPNLKPEEMVSYEIGFMKQYKNRFTIDFAAFINIYDNLIQYVNIGGGIYGPFQVQNIANSQIKGIEFSLDYKSSMKLLQNDFGYHFSVNYTYMDARDLSANRTEDFLPYKPRHLVNFTADLNYRDFYFNLTGKYVSKIDEVLFFKYEEPKAYVVTDAKISKRFSNKFTLFFAVSNLFDVQYQELERTQAPNRNFNSGISLEF
ncbi:MAG: TonB-dependent receptor [Bacteroidetes bacterium]|nr:TonB-dependent receptor [Bacteroidota bacterium]